MRKLLAAALVECMRSAAAAALAVPCKLAVRKDSTAAAVVVGMDLSAAIAVAVGMDLSVAAASTATSAGRSPAEASTVVAMHCTPGRIGSCSRGCKQLVWERSSESAA